jgi:acetyl-CoA acetyltransferase
MQETGTTLEQLAMVAVVQREWAGLNPRASYREPLPVEQGMNARMIANPFTKLECCLVTDGGGALILTPSERAADFPRKPVYTFYGLEDLGFCARGEAGAFIEARHTAIGGKLPVNTNGGGLSYMHSGMYGMYALQESVRQLRGIAPAQIDGARISVAHGVGGMFAASGTIIMGDEPV